MERRAVTGFSGILIDGLGILVGAFGYDLLAIPLCASPLREGDGIMIHGI